MSDQTPSQANDHARAFVAPSDAPHEAAPLSEHAHIDFSLTQWLAQKREHAQTTSTPRVTVEQAKRLPKLMTVITAMRANPQTRVGAGWCDELKAAAVEDSHALILACQQPAAEEIADYHARHKTSVEEIERLAARAETAEAALATLQQQIEQVLDASCAGSGPRPRPDHKGES